MIDKVNLQLGELLSKEIGGTGGTRNYPSFGEYLKKAIENVNSAQINAEKAMVDFMEGNISLADAVLSIEKARLSLHLATQIRNKVVEIYQEIMRMPV